MAGKTPYNSIYEAMVGCPPGDPPCDEDESVICCTHGVQCDYAGSEKKTDGKLKKLQPKTSEGGEDQEGLYINLVDEGASDDQDDLRKQLEGLSLLNKGKNKKSKSKSKQRRRKSKKTEESLSIKREASLIEVEDPVFPRKSGKSKKQRKRDGSAKRQESRRKRSSKSTKSTDSQSSVKDHALKAYIGAMTYQEAEAAVREMTDFRLYHRIESRTIIDDLTEEATFNLVYRTIHGDYRHYPIRQRLNGEKKMCYIDYGDPRAEALPTLDELVRFYKNNVQMHARNADIANQKME